MTQNRNHRGQPSAPPAATRMVRHELGRINLPITAYALRQILDAWHNSTSGIVVRGLLPAGEDGEAAALLLTADLEVPVEEAGPPVTPEGRTP